jgi:hypothetical protein
MPEGFMVYSHSFFADGMQQFGIRGVKIPFAPTLNDRNIT